MLMRYRQHTQDERINTDPTKAVHWHHRLSDFMKGGFVYDQQKKHYTQSKKKN